MKRRRWYIAGAAVCVAAVAVAAGLAMAGSSQGQGLKKVTIQLKWVTQSQFAGYYAAKDKGYYKAAGLDVNLKVGGPDIVNEQTVLSKQAEFGINWMPSLLAQPRPGQRPRQHRAGLCALGNDRGHVQVERDQHVQEDAGEEVRRLDLRERVRAACRARQERHEPGQGRHARQAELRHARVPERRDRRRFRDDLQRARAGARGEEPGYGQALQAVRPERVQVLGSRHRNAPGRHHRPRRLDQGRRRTRPPR